mmetsp:Transcript_4095/g.8254  ORF Transcript_4095/g.8254 Transcript_4095/m.8254 type:complete len:240 (-) Transcript_4095:999-1718(-)
MRDLETHLVATKPRVSRRASFGQNISSAKSLPAYHGSKQQRRASLSGSQSASSSSSKMNHQPATPTVPKKQMRRASLGQMLGSAQRFFTKDDAATCVTTESTCHDAASVISAEEEARVLLKEVKQTIQRHEQRKMEMEQATESSLELAKARLSSGNQLGAVLSMRRVHKNTTMLAYTAGARYQLAQIRDNLQNFKGGDVAEYRKAIRDITNNLLQADAPTPDDEFLLHQLESQMEEVGV